MHQRAWLKSGLAEHQERQGAHLSPHMFHHQQVRARLTAGLAIMQRDSTNPALISIEESDKAVADAIRQSRTLSARPKTH